METDLLIAQIGKETTWGTAVPQTAKLMGIEKMTIKQVAEGKALTDQRGSLAPTYEAQLTKIMAEGSFEGWLSYEDINYWLESMYGLATITGAGPYTYTNEAPLTAKPTPRILTLAYGESTDGVYGLSGGLVNKLTIALASGAEGRVSGELIGQEVLGDTLDALSDRTVNPVMGQHVSLFIDDWAGTIGTTQISNVAFSLELALEAPFGLKHYLGALQANGWRLNRLNGELKMTLEFGAAAKAYVDEFAAASPSLFQKLVRIKASNGANLDMQLDFAGFSEDVPELFTDEDGVSTVEFALKGQYDAGMANWFEYVNINGLATLP